MPQASWRRPAAASAFSRGRDPREPAGLAERSCFGRFRLQPGLQAEDRLRVELRDARLGDAQDLADLAQREVLVVVEGHDELLALGQAGDRVGEMVLHL